MHILPEHVECQIGDGTFFRFPPCAWDALCAAWASARLLPHLTQWYEGVDLYGAVSRFPANDIRQLTRVTVSAQQARQAAEGNDEEKEPWQA